MTDRLSVLLTVQAGVAATWREAARAAAERAVVQPSPEARQALLDLAEHFQRFADALGRLGR